VAYGADWTTVKVWPAIVNVPVRIVPMFCVTLKATVPGPTPDAPAVTVTQSTLDAAVQLHAAPVPTATDPPPAAAGSAWFVGVIE
jgi:hypothetical protein